MSRFVSDAGVWHAGKERVGLVNRSKESIEVDGKIIQPGDPYIYEGPDRAALFALWEAKENTFGEDFRRNPDFLQMIRTRGFKTVNEYLKFVGYDEKVAKERFDKEAAKVSKHELPEAVKRVEKMGGGIDTAGGGLDKTGGFDLPPDLATPPK